jgi:DNA-binding MarR family transcriptional regulator
MPRSTADRNDDRTPQARLTEAALHAVVGYQLAQAAIVTTQVFDAEVGSTCELRPVEYTMLALIQANPDVTARQLARGLAVTPPNIAVWLERLESRGLVQRRRSAADARMQHIRVTAAGSALARESTRRLLDGEAAALAVLSAAERAMLVELLHKVAMARKRPAAG